MAAVTEFDPCALSPDVLHDPARFQQAVVRLADGLMQGRNMLAHTLPGANYLIDAPMLTTRLVELVAAVLARAPVTGLGVAGGDTSSAICQRLGFSALEFDADIDPGVSICTGHHAVPALDGMRLMLKGGQMGGANLFDRFAAACAEGTRSGL
ncbi:nucleotide-binding domain containing protein [Hoeflea ulvae]|uniref:Four-carbon acid sugar kinase nucleotide binding domain-containing protein n=1 Tax=Hoeflea ulvae TaxID=2983764 RepID=A0ABT3YM56_9HYPH|nr:nucleotide-binding domain containing protein [Hoeflea ulvae]MCY0096869.1 hypothetical protein [Hoeflea ulvae]